MAKFISITENDGSEFLLNLDLVISIHPTVNQMTRNSCNIFLVNQRENEVPITVKIEFQKMKQLLEL